MYYLRLLFCFLSLKTDVNVPSKSKKQQDLEKEVIFCWHLAGHWRKKQGPDPFFSGTDPRIRIRTKRSRIHNTAFRNTIVNGVMSFLKTNSGARITVVQ